MELGIRFFQRTLDLSCESAVRFCENLAYTSEVLVRLLLRRSKMACGCLNAIENVAGQRSFPSRGINGSAQFRNKLADAFAMSSVVAQ